MDIFYSLQGFEFGWDKEKAKNNIHKRGIAF